MSRWSALVDEVANELATWPGVRIEPAPDGGALVRYEHVELGLLDAERGIAELPAAAGERDELVERGDALPTDERPHAVSHAIHGPADVTSVLELFDRRYRDVRGEDEPVSSEEPG